MTWVKICGMTNLEDALLAAEAGADAVGFVFYEKSPRCVTVERVRDIVEKLPQSLEKIGVFVNETEERIRSVATDAALSTVQIYGSGSGVSASAREITDISPNTLKVILAMRSDQLVPGKIVSGGLPGSIVHALLLDSGSGENPGGTGRKFDWGKDREYVRSLSALPVKIVVAGGLTPENVSEAVETFEPWGVDVVSGVEASQGKKDPEKVRAFVRAVRDVDGKVS